MAAAPESADKQAAHFLDIKLDKIHESKTNPRRRFADMERLTESVRVKGVLQPVLVRPVDGYKSGQLTARRFELVVGARRFRAAKAAGLATLPCMVRDLEDDEALELQLVENSQRTDVHPIEEAEGYQRLMEKHGRSTAEIATKVSKSESTILARMKLLALSEPVRNRFFDEKFSSSIALEIARIPSPKLQLEAAKGVEGLSYRSAREWIERAILLRLSAAVWKLDDADLVPGAGSCKACPHRTGNQRELFGPTTDKADLCTSPPCFKKKEQATIRNLRKAGRTVLEGKKAEEVHRTNLVQIDREVQHGKKWVRLRALCGKHLDDADVVLVRDRWSKKLEPWAPGPKVTAARKANGKPETKGAAPGRFHSPTISPAAKAKQQRATVKRELLCQAEDEIVGRLAVAVEKADAVGYAPSVMALSVPGPVLFYVARELLEGVESYGDLSDAYDGMLQRRGIQIPAAAGKGLMRSSYEKADKGLRDWMAKAQPIQMLALVVELLGMEHSRGFEARYRFGSHQKTQSTIDGLGKCFGVDAGAIRSAHAGRAKAYLDAVPKPKRSKARAKTKAKAKPRKKAVRRPAASKKSGTKTTQAKPSKTKKKARAT